MSNENSTDLKAMVFNGGEDWVEFIHGDVAIYEYPSVLRQFLKPNRAVEFSSGEVKWWKQVGTVTIPVYRLRDESRLVSYDLTSRWFAYIFYGEPDGPAPDYDPEAQPAPASIRYEDEISLFPDCESVSGD